MADHSNIEWTDATWNPITGCTLVDAGCANCYAAELAATRLKNLPSRTGLSRKNKDGVAKFTGEVRLNENWISQPMTWRKPRMIFVCAHGDLFHENVANIWIDQVFAVMALCPQHTFQVLTKRPKRAANYLNEMMGSDDFNIRFRNACRKVGATLSECIDAVQREWPLDNVWLGTSVSDQKSADERIPALLEAPANVRFISAEPLLGSIDLTSICTGWYFINSLGGFKWHDSDRAYNSEKCTSIDWVICGGESGRKARPMHPDWARSLRRQCKTADVPFFFKQWGEWFPEDDMPEELARNTYGADFDAGRTCRFTGMPMRRIGKKAAGRKLDGEFHDGMPPFVNYEVEIV